MVRIGIIGTGGMANSHAKNFQTIRGVKLAACCDVSAERAEEFAGVYGIPAVYTDYRDMLARERLDGVANVTPDALHAEISLAVIARGIAILCEKPLATSLADAHRMAEAARQAGVINMVNFSYRNSCALQKAAEAVRAGNIGRLIHVEASYLQSWLVSTSWGDWRTTPAFTWRLSTQHGSAGVLGDIGCHIYDMTTLLCGQEIAEIDCRLRTFDKGISDNRIGDYVLDANDSFVSTVAFANGALGTIHASRWAVGHVNSLKVYAAGDEGAIEVDLDRSYSEYRICRGRKGINQAAWKTVACPPTPTIYQRFIRAIRSGVNDASDFANGARVQACLQCSMLSDTARRPVAIEE